MELLGKRVLLSRRDLDLGQDELAERVGVSRPYISKIERGKATGLSMQVLFALADALDVSPAYLQGLTDDPLADVEDSKFNDERVDYDSMDPEDRELLRLVSNFDREQKREFIEGVKRLLRFGQPRIIE